MNLKQICFTLPLVLILFCCKKETSMPLSFSDYPAPIEKNLWIKYGKTETEFNLWSPTASEVKLNLYKNGEDEDAYKTIALQKAEGGIWTVLMSGDLNGTYYTYQTKIEGEWLNETPGIYAQAVGVNGKRAMVLDLPSTNPTDWITDKGPKLEKPNKAVIYELHIRDMTINANSGSSYPGKFIGLTELGTTFEDGITTGIDHMKELGVTHIHLLPAFDNYSIDEAKLDNPQYNWGYDPQNYNVPEGSFSTDPFRAEVRIAEFKQMVKGFHDTGIGVILDVVYNHTGRTEGSNFNLEVPGYYYRQWEDGKWSDASACGNETASERPMARKFMIESILYWAKEYHLDGFRFDLMGIHDIGTMNEIATEVKKINPDLFIYGEGWTAGDSPLPIEHRALKKNTFLMPKISAFSDDIRDGIKGSVFEDKSTGFVSGAPDMEESVKFGVAGAIQHDDINYKAVNYSDEPWALEPWQSVSYVSCHDNHTLYDKLKISRPDASEADIVAMDKLANAIVLTSQGIPFIHAGAELLRTKYGEHNSYNLPDSINQIDWNWKVLHYDVFEYYKQLIMLRKRHPAFYMPEGEMVRIHLSFIETQPGLIGYKIADHANADVWKNILVIYNANAEEKEVNIEGEWIIAVKGNIINENGSSSFKNKIKIPRLSMLIAYQK